MRKIVWLVVIFLLAGGGYYGYQYGKRYVADKVMDQVVEQVMQDESVRELLDDPDVQTAIQEAAAAEDAEALSRELLAGKRSADGEGGVSAGSDASAGGAASGEGGTSTSSSLVVKNVDEAEALVLDKFSVGEIREYAGMARGGLTDEEKALLQDEVTGKFTEEELHALKVIALMEAQKRTGGQ